MKLSSLCLMAFLCTFVPANIQKDIPMPHPYGKQQYEPMNERTLDLEKSILQISTPSLDIPFFPRRDMQERIEPKTLGSKNIGGQLKIGTTRFADIGLKLTIEPEEFSNTGRSTPGEKLRSLSDIPNVLKDRNVLVVLLLKLGLGK